jgi:hypothetical protein
MGRAIATVVWCTAIMYVFYSPPIKVEKEWRGDLSAAQCIREGGEIQYIATEIYSGYKGCLLPKGGI